MNLFVIDRCPIQSAQMQHDQHLRKMILETAQIIDGGTRAWMNHAFGPANYEIVKIPKSHLDNATIRSAADPWVLLWSYAHLCGLLSEFKHRWGHDHAYWTNGVREALWDRVNLIRDALPYTHGFRLAMDDQDRAGCPLYTRDFDVVVPAYRRYYTRTKLVYGEDKKPCTWTRREPPFWLWDTETRYVVNARSPIVKFVEIAA